MTVYHVKHEEALFTPREAARLTGVSAALQRDWRRRGILRAKPGSGHTRFSFSELCELVALKSFSDAGFGPKGSITGRLDGNFRDAKTAASICLLPMLAYAGFDVSSRGPRYVIIDSVGTGRVDKLSVYEESVEAGRRKASSVAVIFDCKTAVEKLLGAIGRPAFTTTTTKVKGA